MEMTGILCDRKASVKIKGVIFRMVVRPAMVFELETAAITTRQQR